MNLINYILNQIDWSYETFGPPCGEYPDKGCLDHIRKEIIEIETANDKQSRAEEYIDVIILALDALWRLGKYPDEIVCMLKDKQFINKSRS